MNNNVNEKKSMRGLNALKSLGEKYKYGYSIYAFFYEPKVDLKQIKNCIK